jgi:hypothetical protein
MKVVERFIAAKSGRSEDCEDGIVVTSWLAAVIDGATDKTGDRYEGMTGGQLALTACSEALQSLDSPVSPDEAMDSMSEALAKRLPSGLSPGERPAAAVSIYSAAHREVWQLGDVGFWYGGLDESRIRPQKIVDRYASELRAAFLRAELASGADPAWLAQHDPGRAAITGILAYAGVFCNNPGAGDWAYGGINGWPVPPGLVKIYQVPSRITELVLASDGYPRILSSLRESEDLLARLLTEDPLCIGQLRGTKGVTPGNESFDDRSYLRLRI